MAGKSYICGLNSVGKVNSISAPELFRAGKPYICGLKFVEQAKSVSET
jgi:hypothetical protein